MSSLTLCFTVTVAVRGRPVMKMVRLGRTNSAVVARTLLGAQKMHLHMFVYSQNP